MRQTVRRRHWTVRLFLVTGLLVVGATGCDVVPSLPRQHVPAASGTSEPGTPAAQAMPTATAGPVHATSPAPQTALPTGNLLVVRDGNIWMWSQSSGKTTFKGRR